MSNQDQDKVNDCIDDLKKFFGLYPYELGNIVENDGDFLDSVRKKYSHLIFQEAESQIAKINARGDKMNREEELEKLEEVREKFENKTKDGLEVRFYDYVESRKYPIIGSFCIDGEWRSSSWTSEGAHTKRTRPAFHRDLVLKKKNLPKDILCEVWNGDTDNPIVSQEVYSDGCSRFFIGGKDSFLGKETRSFDNFKVIENPIRPWFGGECPVPEGLKHQVFIRSRWYDGAIMCDWQWKFDKAYDITAYQILGEK